MICYHASQEQFAPSHLLRLVQKAEQAGFKGIHSSDHFHPWSARQGQSAFTFSWIGAAMQATQLPFSMVCAPGQRLHPAIVAQAISTLCEMYPGRFNIELGSGEALNEAITATPWPSKERRNTRLKESFEIIKRLLAGEEVSFSGEVKVDRAKLYTLPQIQPQLLCAALSVETSDWCAGWADGLLTTAGDIDGIREKLSSYRNNGGKGKSVYLQFAFSYATDRHAALEGAFDQWRANMVGIENLADFAHIEQFEDATKNISRADVEKNIPLFDDIHQLREQIDQYLSLDIERLVLHNINRDQERFIEDFKKVA